MGQLRPKDRERQVFDAASHGPAAVALARACIWFFRTPCPQPATTRGTHHATAYVVRDVCGIPSDVGPYQETLGSRGLKTPLLCQALSRLTNSKGMYYCR